MKFKYIYIWLLLGLLGLAFSGCKKFLEIDAPKNQLVTESAFSSNETANSAMLAIYAQMSDNQENNPYNIGAYTGLAADELTNHNDFTLDIYTNQILPTTSNSANNFWTQSYKMIYYANAILKGCENSIGIDANMKKQLQGEAFFLRAYWHFYLVNLYGDIPIALSTDYKANSTLTRAPIALVYHQIIEDLKLALTNLNEHYVGPNGALTSTLRIRPNKFTAKALLSRAYLYTGDFMSAEKESTDIINNNSYILTPLAEAFQAMNNKEAIWQLMPANNSSVNTYEGANFIPNNSPIDEMKTTISDQLLNAFEAGDLRRSNWIGTYEDLNTSPSTFYYYPFKYKIQFGAEPTEFSVIFRLAELYLIRAEARAQLNNFPGAIHDIDMVRDRAGLQLLANANPSIGKQDLLLAILKERQTELFTEQGHRWFDLKRTKLIDEVMQAATPLKGGGTWNTRKQLWPIPQTELINNPKLTQNDGYN